MRKRTSRATIYALAVFFLFAVTSVPLFSQHAAASTTSSTGIIIPLYVYPSSAWDTLIQAKQAYPNVPVIAVVNPDNGPGSYNPTYASWIEQLQAVGIQVVGYVPTEYASVSTSTAESDIAAYHSLYSLNGIFLDQMSNVASYESYYSTLTSYAHSQDLPMVVGNPGTDVPSGYIGTVNLLVVFENGYLPSLSRLQYITMGLSPSNFATMSYNSSLSMSTVSMIAGYASYLYITSGELPSPYSTFPSYLDTEFADVASLDATFTFTVDSVTSSGATLNGMWTTVTYNGNQVASGFTPLTYTGPAGNTYTVCVSNYQSYTFSHWDDGLTNSCRVFDLDQDRTFTATYST